MGVLGLSYDDFCRLTPEEFGECCKAWNTVEQSREQGDWERMRMLATISVQPHTKKRLTPRTLLPFPWDGKGKKKEKPLPSKEERHKRFQKLMVEMGKA